MKDVVLSSITGILEPYGDVLEVEEGSLVIKIRFHSLIKFTSFWLAHLDGSLARTMLPLFLTDELRNRKDSPRFHLEMEFDLNDYVALAYELNLSALSVGQGAGQIIIILPKYTTSSHSNCYYMYA